MKQIRMSFFTLFLMLSSSGSIALAGPGDSARVSNYTLPSSTVLKKSTARSSWLRSTNLKQYSSDGETSKEYKKWTGLKYSGYIRSYNQYRWMPNRYANAPASEQLLSVNGLDIVNGVYTGYQEPLFLLRLEGSPTAKTWFQVEYMLDNQMMGVIATENTIGQSGISQSNNRRMLAYRMLQFKGYANTKVGDFTITAGGGVNWSRMSPFTLWNYEYRDDMFERYPWQPEGNSFGMYNRFYNEKNIARDSRWGNTGTQGFIINGKNLPKGFGFTLIMGKTDNSGGFQTYLTRTPKNVLALRVDKTLGVHKVGINIFDQFGTYNNIGFYNIDPSNGLYHGAKVRQQIITADARLNFNKFKIYTEVGAGRFQDGLLTNNDYEFLFDKKQTGKDTITPNGVNYNWDNPLKAHCFNFQIDLAKDWLGFPLSAQVFSVRKSVANVNSQSLNTSNNHTVSTPTNINTVNDITVFPGAILDIGQMSNNRWGTNIKHEDTYGKLKVTAAWGFNKEWERADSLDKNNPLGNGISYWHQANAFTRSRFTYFQQQSGPYQRITSIYRRAYENYRITDTKIDYLKMYQTLNLALAYKFRLFDRDLILNNFNTFNSVTDDGFNPIPTFSDKAFLRTFYEELMAFYSIHPKVAVLGFASIERVLGNRRMELADDKGNKLTDVNDPAYATGKTINQTGYGLGAGFDYDFASRAGLYVRHRYFYQKDNNFTRDYFSGHETTVELKIFF
jgi:hypothetical protein